jgi:hypothetical protein
MRKKIKFSFSKVLFLIHVQNDNEYSHPRTAGFIE